MEDAQTRFDTSTYDLDRPLPKEKSKKVIGLFKDEIGRKIVKEFVGLSANIYSYLIDNGSEDRHKKVFYKKCLEASQHENKQSI